MDHTKPVDLPEGFVDDLPTLDGATIKSYIILKELANVARDKGLLNKDGMAEVFCSYEYIGDETGLSKPTIRKAILSLSIKGWICGFKRGYNGGNKSKQNVSNEYTIPFTRTINQEEYYKMALWKKEDKQ